MTKTFDVICQPLIKVYSSSDEDGVVPDPNITETEIFQLCVNHFAEHCKGKKTDKNPMLGHMYSAENWEDDIWKNDVNNISHKISNIWIENGQLKATIELLSVPLTEAFNPDLPVKYIAKICHSYYVTRLTKVDILSYKYPTFKKLKKI